MTKSTRRSIGNRQLDTLQRVSTLFAAEPQAAIAKKIASLTLGGQLTESLFTNGGTEANETDIRSARCFTGNTGIVALRHGYHGRTATVDDAYRGRGGLGLPQAGIVHALPSLPVRPHLSLVRSEMRAGSLKSSSVAPPAQASSDSSPNRSRAWAVSSRCPKNTSRSSSGSSAPMAASSSAMKCRPAGAGPVGNWFGISMEWCLTS